MFLVCFVCNILRRSSGDRGSSRCLCKVARHVLLEVEVSQLLTLLYLKQRLQLGVGINLATILLILKAMGANVGVNLTSHLSAGKLSANGPSKKLGKLLRNESGLDETGRSAVTSLALTLRSLLCDTHLTSNVALKSAEVTAERRKAGTKSVKLGAKLREERTQGSLKSRAIGVGITGGSRSGDGGGGSNRGIRLGSLGGLGSLIDLLGLRSRYGNGSGS
jgi:hypothetical protein